MSSFDDRPGDGASSPGGDMETTGNYLVLLAPDGTDEAMRDLRESTGLAVVSSRDAEGGALDPGALEPGAAVVYDQLGVAIVTVEPDRMPALRQVTRDSGAVLGMEPERVVHALDVATVPAEYLRGYRDAVLHLVDTLNGAPAPDGALPPAGDGVVDETEATWGLQAVKALASRCSGQGVRVAVLDTGLDLEHPDFVDRAVVSASFIAGETVADGNGHGTHCIGTACGPRRPDQLPGYGVAYGSEIYAGKVLSNAGRGSDGGILAGINWEVANQCKVVSMSLGAPTRPGQTYSRVFETAAGRALQAGTVIVAAAGNESRRPAGVINPVAHPANCPSIMAVAALDRRLAVAPFSNRGRNPDGGQVDLAAPGVDVHSSWPMPTRYRSISGTSMATPHVAGVAALLAEAYPRATGADLQCMLIRAARRLPLPCADVGAGLTQAHDG